MDSVLQPLYAACSIWDCPGIAMDATSLGLSIVGDAAILCSVTVPGCAAPASPIIVNAKQADAAITIVSTGYNAYQYASGDASDLDVAIASSSLILSTVPVGGEIVGIGSLAWGIIDPFVPDEKNYGPKKAK